MIILKNLYLRGGGRGLQLKITNATDEFKSETKNTSAR